ncbi:hypothetical protein M885DRAFT_510055 [Pelagophyceae sp. CCMP2097]|nr:hypothetical protein M885DRAFT_510055 [Pelagophyceae sp. CCMP2097]
MGHGERFCCLRIRHLRAERRKRHCRPLAPRRGWGRGLLCTRGRRPSRRKRFIVPLRAPRPAANRFGRLAQNHCRPPLRDPAGGPRHPGLGRRDVFRLGDGTHDVLRKLRVRRNVRCRRIEHLLGLPESFKVRIPRLLGRLVLHSLRRRPSV